MAEAYFLNLENGNRFWREATRCAFKTLEEGDIPPIGSEYITYYIIFNVKMDLSNKSRLVVDEHKNKMSQSR